MEFNITARRSVIVYLRNVRQARQLRRFGIVTYISEKMKYAVIYMNEDEVEQKMQLITHLGFVQSVELSHWPDVDTTVGNARENFEIAVDLADLADEPINEEEL